MKAFDDYCTLEVSVFLDLFKAFDKIWHDGPIFKLQQNGIEGQVVMLLQSYLSDRKQCVVLNGCTPYTCENPFGVPQGSVPHLIIMKNLETDIVSHKLFANDTIIFDVVRDQHSSSANLTLHEDRNF